MSVSETVSDKTPAKLGDFDSLSTSAKLLLAYILNELPGDLQLMRRDPDGIELVSRGWLLEKPFKIHGVGRYELTDAAVKKLEELELRILSSISLEELEVYKERKKATYPWLW